MADKLIDRFAPAPLTALVYVLPALSHAGKVAVKTGRQFFLLHLFTIISLTTALTLPINAANANGTSYTTDYARQNSESACDLCTVTCSISNFSGQLNGDVIGTQKATAVSLVGGQTAAAVATATMLANAATNAGTGGALVRRDKHGNFDAGTITANVVGNVTGDLKGNADTATKASTAAYATTAGSVTKADTADTATNATNATYATSATKADTANNANYAVTAGSATTAGTATNATNATYATSAGNATTATNANYATTAGSASNFTGNQLILAAGTILCNQALQKVTVTRSNQEVIVADNTSILLLKMTGGTGPTITLPINPNNGQILTIAATGNAGGISYLYPGGTIYSATTFSSTIRAVTFIYVAEDNAWYRIG